MQFQGNSGNITRYRSSTMATGASMNDEDRFVHDLCMKRVLTKEQQERELGHSEMTEEYIANNRNKKIIEVYIIKT